MLRRPGRYALRRLDPERVEFQALVEESRLEGYWMLVRLADGWRVDATGSAVAARLCSRPGRARCWPGSAA